MNSGTAINKFITIIFPSRSRLDLVKKLLYSIEENTNKKNMIEVISICDYDDKETLDLFYNISSEISYDFKFVCRKQNETLDLPNDYYSLGLKLASNSYFTWILGNDCELVEKDWDAKFFNAIKQIMPNVFNIIEKDEKYFYIRINDDTHWGENGENINKYGDQSCCFPLLSTNYCKNLKEFYPTEIKTWGGDTILYKLALRSNSFFIVDATRIIKIKHHSSHNQNNTEDEIFKRVSAQHMKDMESPLYFEKNDFKKMFFKKRKKFLCK